MSRSTSPRKASFAALGKARVVGGTTGTDALFEVLAQLAPEAQLVARERVAEEALPALVGERDERLTGPPVDGLGGDLGERQRPLRRVDAEQPDAQVAVGLDVRRVAVVDLLAGAAAAVGASPEPGEPDREALRGLADRLRHLDAPRHLSPTPARAARAASATAGRRGKRGSWP